jgi:hypothetical protein
MLTFALVRRHEPLYTSGVEVFISYPCHGLLEDVTATQRILQRGLAIVDGQQKLVAVPDGAGKTGGYLVALLSELRRDAQEILFKNRILRRLRTRRRYDALTDGRFRDADLRDIRQIKSTFAIRSFDPTSFEKSVQLGYKAFRAMLMRLVRLTNSVPPPIALNLVNVITNAWQRILIEKRFFEYHGLGRPPRFV